MKETALRIRLRKLGITATALARLTGQAANTVHRKARGDQGLRPGAREAGIIACLTVMDDDQRRKALLAFEGLLDEFQ